MPSDASQSLSQVDRLIKSGFKIKCLPINASLARIDAMSGALLFCMTVKASEYPRIPANPFLFALDMPPKRP